jgi:hypothetical protein
MFLIAVGNRNECWEWTGRVNNEGRPGGWPFEGGCMWRNAYVRYWGPIPAEYYIHHVCRNRLCLNSFHLQALSPVDHANARRA